VTAAELTDLASGERFPVERSVTVGREGCDIVVHSELVSRRHAEIRVTPSAVEIEDLGSRNGTFVNGDRIAGARPLRPGDTVEIGDVRLRVDLAPPVGVTKAADVVRTKAVPVPPAAVDGKRGDVPRPEPVPLEAPAAAAGEPRLPVAAPGFAAAGARPRATGASAARRSGATAASLGIIAATAAALIVYFADRGF
jgi:predicted component of type VI protein secretion system